MTHVKVKQKDNQKGVGFNFSSYSELNSEFTKVGFEGHDDTWLAHQDDFQVCL